MYSTQRATSDGTLTLLDISIDYLDRDNIKVLFDSVQQAVGTTWDWVGTTDKRISFTPAVPAGVNVDVVRASDLSEVRHLFAGGAAFLPETMDENFNHILQIAQEARERATLQDVFQNIDMHGFQLVNLAPGTAPGHSVEYSQLMAHDAVIVGYMNTTQGYRDQAQTYRNQAEAFAQSAADSASAGIESLVIANNAMTAATEVGEALDAAISDLTVPEASTTVKGKVQLATSAESQALTDALKSITPATLAAILGVGTLSAKGYAAFPFKDATTGQLRRIIIQWGTVALSGGTAQTVTFPIAFPNALAAAVANYENNAGATPVGISSKRETSMLLAQGWFGSNPTGSMQCPWIAIGY